MARAWRIALLVIAGVLVIFLATEIWAIAHNPNLPPWIGADYTLYMDATRRWLGGGSFYLPDEIAGPYLLTWGAILYPPQALVLFVPFTVLPWPLWYGIPSLITAWVVWANRPALWGWVAILAIVTLFPLEFLVYVVGTPTIWVVAAMALATRWPWASALVLVKPSLAPFGLVGIRDRRWWAIVALSAILGLVVWPMTLDWVKVLLNQRGANLLYSQGNVWVMLVPIVAWLSASAPRSTSGVREPRPDRRPDVPSVRRALRIDR